jgi:hypothetical protein
VLEELRGASVRFSSSCCHHPKSKVPIHNERLMAGYAGHLSLSVRCLID